MFHAALPDAAAGRRRRPWLAALAGALAATVIAALTLHVVRPRVEAGTSGTTANEVAAPPTWDPAVIDLVAFVEGARGLRFAAPVPVDFVSRADAARAQTREAAEAAADSTLAATGRYAAALTAALELPDGVGAPVPVGGTGAATPATVPWATYLARLGRIVVPAEPLPANWRADVVGQLALALDDQHFGWSRSAPKPSAGSQSVQLAHGDAWRIRRAFVAEQDPTAGDAAVEPLGAALADQLVATVGAVGIDRLLTDRPAFAERLFDPTQPDRLAVPLTVDLPQVPRLASGDEVMGIDQVGPEVWYGLLATAVEPGVALRAAYGWGGDAVTVVQRGTRPCAYLAWRGDTSADDHEMTDALATWAGRAPERRRVTRVGTQLEVEACAPGAAGPDAAGPAATLPNPSSPPDSGALLARPLLVTHVVIALAAEGRSVDQARCAAIAVTATLPDDRVRTLAALPVAQTVASLGPGIVEQQAACAPAPVR
jgi:hypothetical protein